MELLFVTVISAGIGLILAVLVPGRDRYGILIPPAAAAAVTAALWVVLVYAGLTFDGGWIWVASLVAGGLVALALTVLLPRRRDEADERMLQRLLRGQA